MANRVSANLGTADEQRRRKKQIRLAVTPKIAPDKGTRATGGEAKTGTSGELSGVDPAGWPSWRVD